MKRTYWDTSALLKVYVPESDSDYFFGLLAKGDHLVCSSVITAVEFRCALYRKAQAGDIRPADAKKAMELFTSHCSENRITQVACDPVLIRATREFVDLAAGKEKLKARPVLIRGLDAIHIASAFSVGASALVTTDVRMRELTARLDLKLLPPAGTS